MATQVMIVLYVLYYTYMSTTVLHTCQSIGLRERTLILVLFLADINICCLEFSSNSKRCLQAWCAQDDSLWENAI